MAKHKDDEILKIIIQKTGKEPKRVERDASGNVIVLDYSEGGLTSVPEALGSLTNLQELYLSSNQLTSVPEALGSLTNLERLYLFSNQLTSVPEALGSLTNLKKLSLSSNQLTSVPEVLGSLTALAVLNLSSNQLTSVPEALGSLTKLTGLYLSSNQLTSVPEALGSLTKLTWLNLSSNQLTSPPPEVVEQGTNAVLEYLRNLKDKGEELQYRAKLVFVGEGATGKTWTLCRLQGKDPTATEVAIGTTEGIDIDSLVLDHPTNPPVRMELSTWDFGGQQIYHATHQLFLTKRSLYLLCWNARKDVDQCRIDYWLRTISSLAPDSPVLLVATHSDERAPDINYPKFKEKYPQLIGSLAVSNTTGAGIDELREAVRSASATLPQMGEPWPKNWVAARDEIVELSESTHHIDRTKFESICAGHEIAGESVNRFASTLHDLGHILYFYSDVGLEDMVILQPEWITKAISKVLTDKVTRDEHKGVLHHDDLARVWEDHEPKLHSTFLRLTEKFDLSYRLHGRNASVVAQLLPYEPPVHPWPLTSELPAHERQLAMDFRLSFVPAGVMTWFIVRTHRFTIDKHWRDGVYLECEGHRARAELDTEQRQFRIEVRGPMPAYFYSVLKDSVDHILERFPGLDVKRNIPCVCPEIREVDEQCLWRFAYENLVDRLKKGKDTVECQTTLTDVPINRLLYGIHPSTNDVILEELRSHDAHLTDHDAHVMAELHQLADLNTRNWLKLWNLELHKLEAECPSLLTISPMDQGIRNKKTLFSKSYDVHLWCQMPGEAHPTLDGYYELKTPQEWVTKMRPWISGLLTTLKYAVLVGTSGVQGFAPDAVWKVCENKLKAMERMVKLLPADRQSYDFVSSEALGMDVGYHRRDVGPFGGMDLRMIKQLLEHIGAYPGLGGLRRTISPEGDILWLCPKHYKVFDPGLPVLDAVKSKKKQ